MVGRIVKLASPSALSTFAAEILSSSSPVVSSATPGTHFLDPNPFVLAHWRTIWGTRPSNSPPFWPCFLIGQQPHSLPGSLHGSTVVSLSPSTKQNGVWFEESKRKTGREKIQERKERGLLTSAKSGRKFSDNSVIQSVSRGACFALWQTRTLGEV